MVSGFRQGFNSTRIDYFNPGCLCVRKKAVEAVDALEVEERSDEIPQGGTVKAIAD